jgi:MoxR-like ATPase
MAEPLRPATTSAIVDAAKRLGGALAAAKSGLVDRETLVELVALGMVASEHLLVIGPPGTAKSAAVRAVASKMGGRTFEYLLGRFTEPSEIFGPVSLSRLREGIVEIETAGMLPEAEIAFLDEVFRGSTAILNTLLTLLNERRFRRGATQLECPLRICVGAANELPTDPELSAFSDRFLLHCFVEPLADPLLEDLLSEGWSLEQRVHTATTGLDVLEPLHQGVLRCELSKVRPLIAGAVRQLRGAGIELTDRRIVKLQRLVAAAAVLDGRFVPDARDLWPIVYAIPSADGQARARDVLEVALESTENGALSQAAGSVSASPAAWSTDLIERGSALIQSGPNGLGDPEWRQRLEAVAREIDSGFGPGERSPELEAVRDKIRSLIQVTT